MGALGMEGQECGQVVVLLREATAGLTEKMQSEPNLEGGRDSGQKEQSRPRC